MKKMAKATETTGGPITNVHFLSLWERGIYFLTWVTCAIWTVYCVYVASYEHKYVIRHDLKPGWIMHQSKDTSDSEWALISNAMHKGFGLWLVGHVLIGQIVRWSSFESRSWFFIVYDLIAVICTIGWRPVVLMFVEATLLCIVACWTASQLAVWMTSAIFLLMFQFTLTYKWLESLGIFLGAEPMLVEYGLAMSLLRSISGALSICVQSAKSDSSATCEYQTQDGDDEETAKSTRCVYCVKDIKYFVCYLMYLPVFFSGPLMTFDVFYEQFRRPKRLWTATRISKVGSLIGRVALWTVVFEITIHFFHFSAFFSKLGFMARTSLWTAAGVSYLHGQFFMVKYFVIFGGAGALAMLDQMTPPAPPSCISRTYRYSYMWRSFDRGLYYFMSQHIYFALGGSRRGVLRRTLAIVLCFTFVYTWHGLWSNIFFWSLLNLAGIMIEAIADYISSRQRVLQLEAEYLSPAWSQRLKAAMAIPLTAMSCFAIFTFFAGNDVGYTLFHRLLFEGFPLSTLLILICLYCFNNTCKDIEVWEARRHADSVDLWEDVKIKKT